MSVIVAGLLFGGVASAAWYGTRLVAQDPEPGSDEARTIGNGVDSYAALVEAVAPAVVTIRSERRTRAPQQFPFANDPFFRRFFGDQFGNEFGAAPPAPQMPRPRQVALGSGVIVRPDGHILTNHHVVDGAEDITVELSDRRSFPATVVGSDPPSDLAVLKIEADGLKTVPMGNSEEVNVGDVVLALGNPLGVGQTVTMGIISAKGRATGVGAGSFEDFLQTDAPINTGNSGGALVNTRGELVGINSQIMSPSGGNIGIGFAIPVAMAKDVMQQLIETGSVQRAQLGVTVQTIDSDLAKSLDLPDIAGALVSDVTEGSPADRAGLKRGDVIVAVDGQRVANSNDLRNRIASSKPNSSVQLRIARGGREQTVTATLGELEMPANSGSQLSSGSGETGEYGLSVEPLTDETARTLEVDAKSGLVVRAVEGESPAADAGLRAGDVIETVDGQAVTSAKDLRDALNARSDRPALLLVHREQQTLFMTMDRA